MDAHTPRKEHLDHPFDRQEYSRGPAKHLFLQWIDDQFACSNPACESPAVKCIWYLYEGIDPGVDRTFGEFHCPACGKYTFVQYDRDSS